MNDETPKGATPSGSPENERVRRIYERLAGRYDRSVRFWDRVLGLEDDRHWICSRARGDVLEIGVGTGLNLALYPADVHITGIDLSPAMLEVARHRAAELGREVDLEVGDAQALEFPDDRFDSVVFSLALCSIPDDGRAIAEARRVLRPQGRLLVLEHVRSPARVVRAGQRLLEPLAVRFQADHLLREPLDHLRAEGLVVESVDRSAWGIVERVSARKSS